MRAEKRGKKRFSKLCSLHCYPLSPSQHHIVRSSPSGCSLSVPVPQPILPISTLLGVIWMEFKQTELWLTPKAVPTQEVRVPTSPDLYRCQVAGPQLSGGHSNTLVIVYIFPPYLAKEKPVLDKEPCKFFFLIHGLSSP